MDTVLVTNDASQFEIPKRLAKVLAVNKVIYWCPDCNQYHLIEPDWDKFEKRLHNFVRGANLCEACFFGYSDTPFHFARWRVPQSTDKGKTVTYMNVCNKQHDEWWVDADWDGRKLEKKL